MRGGACAGIVASSRALLFVTALLAMSATSRVVSAASMWQPICPPGGHCSANGAIPIEAGRALVGYTSPGGFQRRQWVALDTGAAATNAGFSCSGLAIAL